MISFQKLCSVIDAKALMATCHICLTFIFPGSKIDPPTIFEDVLYAKDAFYDTPMGIVYQHAHADRMNTRGDYDYWFKTWLNFWPFVYEKAFIWLKVTLKESFFIKFE